MTLPPRIAKKPKRDSRWRSPAHCNFVRSHHCSMDGCGGMPIEVAHVRVGSGAGMSQKPDDWRTVPLCKWHHARQHEIGERTFWANREADGFGSIDDLIDAFCKASPKAREIAQAKRERGL